MRHRCDVKRFSRKAGARKALFRGLVTSLVEHERVRTTLPKAKELRRHVEKAVTIGQKGGVHASRLLFSKYPNAKTVTKLVNDLGPRFKERPGGYTRIRKLGPRPGDGAPMAFIEFVDYDPSAQVDKKVTVVSRDENRKKVSKELSKDEYAAFMSRVVDRKKRAQRKHLRKVSNRSRNINR